MIVPVEATTWHGKEMRQVSSLFSTRVHVILHPTPHAGVRRRWRLGAQAKPREPGSRERADPGLWNFIRCPIGGVLRSNYSLLRKSRLHSRKSNVTSVIQKSKKDKPVNYCPVSLPSIPGNLTENLILESIYLQKTGDEKKSTRTH